MYQLLGRLSNGTRLHVDISDDGLDICDCWDAKGLGNTQVVVEAALVGDNITLALVNMCNCTVSVGLWYDLCSQVCKCMTPVRNFLETNTFKINAQFK